MRIFKNHGPALIRRRAENSNAGRFCSSRLRWYILPVIVWAVMSSALPSRAQGPNTLHAEGSKIVDSNGNQVILTGINWFGLETESFAPHGLWARSLESMLDQIQELGFNTIRLPYSNELFEPTSMPNNINYDLNPDLVGLNGLEVMDKIVEGAGERNIRVMLDRHRPDSHAQSELWYTAQYSEERWIDDWVMLAERYKGNDTVIGADLHNEPHGQATWGSGDPATDWRLAAERAGNAILAANPNWLIIVQGVERYQDDWYWWGGNLLGAREYPVRLDRPEQLAYSSHVYGPGVYPQPWFSATDFPENLPAIWDAHWGYLSLENIAPVVVGEFGGRSVGEDAEGIWQRTLVSYLREHNLSYFYWTLNPNSGDTGGLLLDDWESVDPAKEALLSQYQFPSIGARAPGPEGSEPAATPEPAEPPPTLAPLNPEAIQVAYRTVNAAEQSQDAKPEFIISNGGPNAIPMDRVELRYWLSDDSDQMLVFHCDWAAVGCANVLGEFEATEDGQQYLGLHFGPGAGTLSGGADSGEIKIRFNRHDWSPFDKADDYSFGPLADYAEWDKVTLYVDGQRVWGTEPGQTAQGEPTGVPPTPTPAAPTQAPPTATVAETPTGYPAPTVASEDPAASGQPLAEATTSEGPGQPTIGYPAAEEISPAQEPEPAWATIALIVIAGLFLVGLGAVIGLWLGGRRG